MGNRVTVFSGQTDSYASNNLNQYSSVNGVPFTYDLNGNLTSDGVQTYYYDCENRLTRAVRNSDGQVLGEYKYDPFGRRAQKTVNGQPSTVNYLLDGAQVLEERDGDWTLLRSYVYGTGIDEPLVLVSNLESQSYFYCFDSLGSVTEIADSSGEVVERYRYSPFGAVRIYDSSWSELTESSVGNTCSFTGRNIDRETGLYFYRASMYSAGLGRFLQPDPIGYSDDNNLYRYCNNNPIQWVDPIGYAYFANRPLKPFPWMGDASHIPLDDYFNTELAHEQIFFEDAEGGNIGYFPVGLQSEDCPKGYRITKIGLNDKQLRQAVANVKPKPFQLLYLPLPWNKYNCQNWAQDVRREYDRLKSGLGGGGGW